MTKTEAPNIATMETASESAAVSPAVSATGPLATGQQPTGDERAEVSRRPHVRWWVAVVVGTTVSIPVGWLLSYAAMLPFFIGLFFFALFGLFIGAVTYRVAVPRRPFRRLPLTVGTTIIVAAGWATSLVVECQEFPRDMAQAASERTRNLGGKSVHAYRAAVADEVGRYLEERYPPGGGVGYLRWILTNGELRSGELPSVRRTLERSPRRYVWAVQVVLSIVLLSFGVASQTLPLKLATESSFGAKSKTASTVETGTSGSAEPPV